MSQAEERFAVFPLRGIFVPQGSVTPDIFEREWSIVSIFDGAAIDGLFEAPSMEGHFQHFRARLQADAMLIVKDYTTEKMPNLWWPTVVNRAAGLIAGLNILSLVSLSDGYESGGRSGRVWPRPNPLWVPRISEAPELSLAFTRTHVIGSGHSQAVNWADDSELVDHPWPPDALAQAIKRSPRLVADLINGTVPNSIRNSAGVIAKSFDVASQGQFVSNCLTSVDVLFNGSDASRWESMALYAETLCGEGSAECVKLVFDARHSFVHRQHEPSDPFMHFRALAVSLACLLSFYELTHRHRDHRAALATLDACAKLRRSIAMGPAPEATNALAMLLPHVERPAWVDSWLTAPLMA